MKSEQSLLHLQHDGDANFWGGTIVAPFNLLAFWIIKKLFNWLLYVNGWKCLLWWPDHKQAYLSFFIAYYVHKVDNPTA